MRKDRVRGKQRFSSLFGAGKFLLLASALLFLAGCAGPAPAPLAPSADLPAHTVPEETEPAAEAPAEASLGTELLSREEKLHFTIGYYRTEETRYTISWGSDALEELSTLLRSVRVLPCPEGETPEEPPRLPAFSLTFESNMEETDLRFAEKEGKNYVLYDGVWYVLVSDAGTPEAMRALFLDAGTAENFYLPMDHSSLTEDGSIALVTEYPDYAPGEEDIWFVMENRTEKGLNYKGVQLEALRDGVWCQVLYRPFVGETLLLPTLPAESSLAGGISMYVYDQPLTPGRYRLCLYYTMDSFLETHSWDHNSFAEFEVVEQPERPEVLPPITEQTMDPAAASAQGCAVVTEDSLLGEESLRSFLNKASLGIPCELRILWPERGLIRDISSSRGREGTLSVTSLEEGQRTEALYDFLFAASDGWLFLSRWNDPESAAEAGLSVEEEDHLPLMRLPEDLAAFLRKRLRPLDDQLIQSLRLESGTVYVRLSYTEERIGQEYFVSVGSGGWSKMLMQEYSSEGTHPLRLDLLGENSVRITLSLPEGGVATRDYIYEPEKRWLTEDHQEDISES